MMLALLRRSCRAAATGAVLTLASTVAGAQASPPNPKPSSSAGAAPSALPDEPARQNSPFANGAARAQAARVAPVTVLEDTPIQVMTNDSLNSKRAKENAPFLCTVSEDVMVGDVVAVPRGATVHGVVVKAEKSGVLTGSPDLTLKLVQLDLGGRRYPLYTYLFEVKGLSKTKPTEEKALVGAELGTIAGSMASGVSREGVQHSSGAGRAAGMATGAAIGAGVGTAVSALTPGPGVWIPAESEIDFALAAPITVTPLSAAEAKRLGEGLNKGGPVLYVRGQTP